MKLRFAFTLVFFSIVCFSFSQAADTAKKPKQITYEIELRGPIIAHIDGQEQKLKFDAAEVYKGTYQAGWEKTYKDQIRATLQQYAAQFPDVQIGDIDVIRGGEKVATLRFPTWRGAYPAGLSSEQHKEMLRRDGPPLGYLAVARVKVTAKIVTEHDLIRVPFDQPIEGKTEAFSQDINSAVTAYQNALKSYRDAATAWQSRVNERFRYVPRYGVLFMQDPLHYPDVEQDENWGKKFLYWGHWFSPLPGVVTRKSDPVYGDEWWGWKVQYREATPSVWILSKDTVKQIQDLSVASNHLQFEMQLQGEIYGHIPDQDDQNKNNAVYEYNEKFNDEWFKTFQKSLVEELGSQYPIKKLTFNRGYESVPTLTFDAKSIAKHYFPPLHGPLAYTVREQVQVDAELPQGLKVEKVVSDIPVIGKEVEFSGETYEVLRQALAQYDDACKQWREEQKARYTNHPVYLFVYAQDCRQHLHLSVTHQAWRWENPYKDHGGFSTPIGGFIRFNRAMDAEKYRPADGLVRQWYAKYENRRPYVWLIRR